MKLKVATLNIRNSDANDGPHSWPNRKSLLTTLLQDLDADIIGLQEVLKIQLDEIQKQLPEYGFVGVGRLDGVADGEFAPIFFRKDKFEVGESGNFWLSETPEIPGSISWDTACERICTWAKVAWEGKSLYVFNTHLDHVSAEARLKGTQLILGRIKEPAVLIGDFNALPADPPIQLAKQAGFEELLEGKSDHTFHDFGRNPSGQIDYIITKGIANAQASIFSTQRGDRFASDHHGILAEIHY